MYNYRVHKSDMGVPPVPSASNRKRFPPRLPPVNSSLNSSKNHDNVGRKNEENNDLFNYEKPYYENADMKKSANDDFFMVNQNECKDEIFMQNKFHKNEFLNASNKAYNPPPYVHNYNECMMMENRMNTRRELSPPHRYRHHPYGDKAPHFFTHRGGNRSSGGILSPSSSSYAIPFNSSSSTYVNRNTHKYLPSNRSSHLSNVSNNINTHYNSNDDESHLHYNQVKNLSSSLNIKYKYNNNNINTVTNSYSSRFPPTSNKMLTSSPPSLLPSSNSPNIPHPPYHSPNFKNKRGNPPVGLGGAAVGVLGAGAGALSDANYKNISTNRIIEEAKERGFGPRDKPLAAPRYNERKDAYGNDFLPYSGGGGGMNAPVGGVFSKYKKDIRNDSFVADADRIRNTSFLRMKRERISGGIDIDDRIAKKPFPCKFFAMGDCHMGERCPYIHNNEIVRGNGNRNELSFLPAPIIPKNMHHRKDGIEKVICKHWEKGNCWRGNACLFAHPALEKAR